MIKRLFDVVIASIALVLVSPLLVAAGILIKLDSRGPVLFMQERIGLGFRPFRILKLRSMRVSAGAAGPQITAGGDARITRVGRFLRKTKLDELPQLINVLVGDMSLVGPRPEVARYVQMFRDDYAKILTCRPGITDLASIRYRDEEAILAEASDPEKEYVERVLPEKIRLALEYIEKRSLLLDLRILAETAATVLRLRQGRTGRP